jgi:hypothetical protein
MQQESGPRPPQPSRRPRVRKLSASAAWSIRIGHQPDSCRASHRAMIRANQVLPIGAEILS